MESTMIRPTHSTFARWLSLAVLVVVAGATPASGVRHLKLDRADPAVNGTVTQAPTAIRLYFSQAPQIKGTSVHVLDAKERAVPLADAHADPKDGKIVIADVKAAVIPGTYTVAWRAMAADGHVVKGDFRFTYAAN
jgi:methionine-rich copper-binding protein CopC